MNMRTIILTCGLLVALSATAQSDRAKQNMNEMESASFVPLVKVGKVLEGGDSIQYMEMYNVYVYPELVFKNEKQKQSYLRLVKNVKTVLPIAKEVNQILIETAEYLDRLPTKEEKEAHIKLVEKGIMKQYKPRMKKLTYSQGKLLIKLIDRECNSPAYDLVKAFLGPIRSGFYQAFAWVYGASLKKEYDPDGTDKLTERVVLMVESGQL
jgi:hypothetical protein